MTDIQDDELWGSSLPGSDSEIVEDEAETDETVARVSYQITSYGADYDVEGLVRRLKREDIFVPSFQRNYVWTLPQASRFIESLLLGLPVPGVFLAREESTNRFLILDGQQRLKSLLFFYEGLFNPPGRAQRIFALNEVQKPLEQKTYKTLDERDRRRLDDAIVHATIVQQEAPPEEEDTSLFYIFERLNSGGTRLTHEEARCAVFHGSLIDKVKELNNYRTWRDVFGKEHARLKDQELILRFLALYFNQDRYARPMAEFLNKFVNRNQNANEEFLGLCRRQFERAIDLCWQALGNKAFRPERALNAAVFDSVMVGLARRLQKEVPINPAQFAEAYYGLLADNEYSESVSRSTADEHFVSLRLKKAAESFAAL
jgi:uncharacterized protein with ParB-like and HNH nuclease domain